MPAICIFSLASYNWPINKRGDKKMMEVTDLRTFLKDVEHLMDEHKALKEQAYKLNQENFTLKHANQTLVEKNKAAKDAVFEIISKLKESTQ